MDLYLNAYDLHRDPATWAKDVSDFRPSRWLDDTGKPIAAGKETFVPWGLGPRICPGMKMAQVEFVAAIASLFSRFTMDPIHKPGESIGDARKALLDLIENSEPRLTMQMNRPEDIKLRFIER